MNIELILWIVAFFVVWETLYIIGIKRKWHYGDWVPNKITSFLLTFLFMMIQFAIVSNSEEGHLYIFPLSYINLLWEAIIVGALVIFFHVNKQIAKSIEKPKKKKSK